MALHEEPSPECSIDVSIPVSPLLRSRFGSDNFVARYHQNSCFRHKVSQLDISLPTPFAVPYDDQIDKTLCMYVHTQGNVRI